MSENDRVVLDSILERRGAERPDLDADEFFELFAQEQLLKARDASTDEIRAGITDGPNDGGIDGFFTYVDDQLFDDAFDIKSIRDRKPRIDVYVSQVKTSPGFSEQPLQTVESTLADLLDLANDLGHFDGTYREDLLEQVSRFRTAYLDLSDRFPSLTITCFYVCKGSTQAVSRGVERRREAVVTRLRSLFRDADIKVELIGSRELLEHYRREPSYALKLPFVAYATTGDGYVALVRLTDYGTFVRDEAGELRRYLFDANVRDYQGRVEVNKEVRETLEGGGSTDFWWLNNGITILASAGSIAGMTLSLSDVQIVNGLQTTNEIHAYLQGAGADVAARENRSVLVKVITSSEDAIRDRVIRATNFQTAIPPASFRATEKLQRDIEEYFLARGWFYDRRKNHYRNLGKPAERIVGIPFLAQAVSALVLHEPDASRARPASLVRSNDAYRRIFTEKRPLETYLYCARNMRFVDRTLREERIGTTEHRRKLRFHVASVAVDLKQAGPDSTRRLIESAPDLETEDVVYAFDLVLEALSDYQVRAASSLDNATKAREFSRVLQGLPDDKPDGAGSGVTRNARLAVGVSDEAARHDLSRASPDLVSAYAKLEGAVRSLGDVSVRSVPTYISFDAGGRSFMTVRAMRSDLRLHFSVPWELAPKPAPAVMRDVTHIGHYGIGSTEFRLSADELLPAAVAVARAAFEHALALRAEAT